MAGSAQKHGLSFVLGGAASGKSAFAERLVAGSGLAPVYVATARAGDAEMDQKIAAHIARRGAEWRTVHAPGDADGHLSPASGTIVLFDSVTLWVAENLDAGAAALIDRLEAGLAGGGPVVAVSDEVGLGIVPDNAAARAFRNTLGQVNQWLAARAELVVSVHAGLPMALKGRLPGDME